MNFDQPQRSVASDAQRRVVRCSSVSSKRVVVAMGTRADRVPLAERVRGSVCCPDRRQPAPPWGCCRSAMDRGPPAEIRDGLDSGRGRAAATPCTHRWSRSRSRFSRRF